MWRHRVVVGLVSLALLAVAVPAVWAQARGSGPGRWEGERAGGSHGKQRRDVLVLEGLHAER